MNWNSLNSLNCLQLKLLNGSNGFENLSDFSTRHSKNKNVSFSRRLWFLDFPLKVIPRFRISAELNTHFFIIPNVCVHVYRCVCLCVWVCVWWVVVCVLCVSLGVYIPYIYWVCPTRQQWEGNWHLAAKRHSVPDSLLFRLFVWRFRWFSSLDLSAIINHFIFRNKGFHNAGPFYAGLNNAALTPVSTSYTRFFWWIKNFPFRVFITLAPFNTTRTDLGPALSTRSMLEEHFLTKRTKIEGIDKQGWKAHKGYFVNIILNINSQLVTDV